MKIRTSQNIIKALALTSLTLLVSCATHRQGVQTANVGWTCWEKSNGGNGHWYKAVPATSGITWTEADKLAHAEGGYLATITSEAENDFVFGLINSPKFFTPDNGYGPALGGFQLDRAPEPDGGWCWCSGDAWHYSNWKPWEPNNGYSGEDRLSFLCATSPKRSPQTPAAHWNDVNRNDLLGGYVIERDN